MRKTLTGLSLAAILISFTPGRSEDKKEERARKLAGTYTIVSGEKAGEKVPEEHIQGATVRFTEDRIIATDKEKKETYVATYKLDTSKTPYTIAMTTVLPKKGEDAKGIIEVKGDSVRLIYSLPGGDTPSEFKSKDKQQMFVLKRTGK